MVFCQSPLLRATMAGNAVLVKELLSAKADTHAFTPIARRVRHSLSFAANSSSIAVLVENFAHLLVMRGCLAERHRAVLNWRQPDLPTGRGLAGVDWNWKDTQGRVR